MKLDWNTLVRQAETVAAHAREVDTKEAYAVALGGFEEVFGILVQQIMDAEALIARADSIILDRTTAGILGKTPR